LRLNLCSRPIKTASTPNKPNMFRIRIRKAIA
jgi:hypothetical protein